MPLPLAISSLSPNDTPAFLALVADTFYVPPDRLNAYLASVGHHNIRTARLPHP